MGVLNPPFPKYPYTFSKFPLFAPNFSFTTWTKESSYKFHIPSSKFHKTPSFSLYLPFSTSRNSLISAHFGRPMSRRRNSLRKKLVDDPQVRENSITLNPNHSLDDSESYRENSEYNGVKESDFDNGVGASSVKELKTREERLGDSILLSELENWVTQYKNDAEFWGIGSGPVFNVVQGLDGNVERVSVDEDEIWRRSQVEQGFEDFKQVNSKISHAKYLAREMESGKNVIPRNSSVAKFTVSGRESGFVRATRFFTLRPEFFPRLSRVGIAVLCGFVVLWAVKKLFSFGNNEVKYTALEKEMMRRKIKSRKEKEVLEKGSVEVVQESKELPMIFSERPKLDKQELMNSINQVNAWNGKLALHDSSSSQTVTSLDLDDKIQEIREMARRAREIEGQELGDGDGEEKQVANEEVSNEIVVVEQHREEAVSFLSTLSNGDSGQTGSIDGTIVMASQDKLKTDDNEFHSEVASVEDRDMQASSTSSVQVSGVRQSTERNSKDSEDTLHVMDTRKVIQSSDATDSESYLSKKCSIRKKPRVIRSVKEAKEYLSKKRDQQAPYQEPQLTTAQETVSRLPSDKGSGSNTCQRLDMKGIVLESSDKGLTSNTCQRLDMKVVFGPAILDGTSDSTPAIDTCEDSTKDKEYVPTNDDDSRVTEEECEEGDFQKARKFLNHDGNGNSIEKEKNKRLDMKEIVFESAILGGPSDSAPAKDTYEDHMLKDMESVPTKDDDSEGSEEECGVVDFQKPQTNLNHENNGNTTETEPSVKMENWMEKNFHEVEPIVKKIGAGFRDNYMVARESK